MLIRLSGELPKASCIVSFLLFLVPFFTYSQIEKNYFPRKTYSSSSKELINALESQLRLEFKSLGRVPHKEFIRQIYLTKEKILVRNVRDGNFIQDDTLESHVFSIVDRIVTSNNLKPSPRCVLIAETPVVNAACFGWGIYVLTVGLMGRVFSEDQLAFVIAHEMAHDEMSHVPKQITKVAEINLAKKTKEQIANIINGKVNLEKVEEFRKLVYGISRYSRAHETQADSMAISLLKNAGYNTQESVAMLDILESSNELKYDIGLELFLPLHCEEYPFRDYWLDSRLSIYEKQISPSFFLFSNDSLESHPDINLRKEAIHTSLDDDYLPAYVESDIHSITLAEFQTVESAYKRKMYDYCLFHALQLMNKYPQNSYLVSRAAKVLLDFHQARETETSHLYVSRYTVNYGDELRLVNNLLHNINIKELGELIFHFINYNSRFFNEQDENHYYILWKICDLTYRYDLRDRVKEDFSRKFGKSILFYKYK